MNGFQLDYAYLGLAVFDQVLVNAANGVITANSIGIGMSDLLRSSSLVSITRAAADLHRPVRVENSDPLGCLLPAGAHSSNSSSSSGDSPVFTTTVNTGESPLEDDEFEE